MGRFGMRFPLVGRQGLCYGLLTAGISAITLCAIATQPALAQGPQGPSGPGTGRGANTPATSTRTAGTNTDTATHAAPHAEATAVVSLKKQISGDFTYRFVSDADTSLAPASLPNPATADALILLPVPPSVAQKPAVLEVTDKTRGNVARFPVASNTQITLTEASFKYVQTVYVSVQHSGKPVTDVLVTMQDAGRKYSDAWLLKGADTGTAQFSNVPMGEPITVAVNFAGHPSTSQTTTLISGSNKDGYHWPVINVDWQDVATVAVAASPTPSSAAAPVPATGTRDERSSSSGGERSGGGVFSSLVNELFALAIIAAIIYGVVWAFNKGHIKTLLDRAGINTAQLQEPTGPQSSPFDKPAKAPLTPITDGTVDPFGGGALAVAATAPVSAGPRLVGTAGSYSGAIFPLSGSAVDIGRDPNNGVPLPNDTNSSRRHATIVLDQGQYSLIDNNSSNGTFLNGVRIQSSAPQPLRSGDEVQVGMTRFRFEAV